MSGKLGTGGSGKHPKRERLRLPKFVKQTVDEPINRKERGAQDKQNKKINRS